MPALSGPALASRTRPIGKYGGSAAIVLVHRGRIRAPRCADPMDFEPSFLERGRIYAIGDIHGRSDLLERMITLIRDDLQANAVGNCVTVTLGDYVDRACARGKS
jgi:hypothetical protein